RKHHITRRNFPHGFIEMIPRTVGVALGRPEVASSDFMAGCLILVDPPISHSGSDGLQISLSLLIGWRLSGLHRHRQIRTGWPTGLLRFVPKISLPGIESLPPVSSVFVRSSQSRGWAVSNLSIS